MKTILVPKKFLLQVDRRLCKELIKIISDLWYDKSIEMVLFEINYRQNVSDIINLHQYAGEFVVNPLFLILLKLQEIFELNLPPAKLDIGKLTYEYLG
jgi:glyceraldehyde 3-phosphate dehydrogenase